VTCFLGFKKQLPSLLDLTFRFCDAETDQVLDQPDYLPPLMSAEKG
jgi:hypothetical protein